MNEGKQRIFYKYLIEGDRLGAFLFLLESKIPCVDNSFNQFVEFLLYSNSMQHAVFREKLADMLGFSSSSLRRKMSEYGLEFNPYQIHFPEKAYMDGVYTHLVYEFKQLHDSFFARIKNKKMFIKHLIDDNNVKAFLCFAKDHPYREEKHFCALTDLFLFKKSYYQYCIKENLPKLVGLTQHQLKDYIESSDLFCELNEKNIATTYHLVNVFKLLIHDFQKERTLFFKRLKIT